MIKIREQKKYKENLKSNNNDNFCIIDDNNIDDRKVLTFKKGTFLNKNTFNPDDYLEYYSINHQLTLRQKIYLKLVTLV